MHPGIVICCVLLSMNRICADAASVYDQSQTGKLNVQVDLKDLNLFAILKGNTKEEYVDYDYAYDYSEMTIKPHGHKSTTPKPATNTTGYTDFTSNAGNITVSQLNVTTILSDNTTEPIKTNTTATTEQPFSTKSTDPTTVKNMEDATKKPENHKNSTVTSITLAAVSNSTSTNCRKGFFVNQKGGCEMRLHGTTGNALLKLVKLSQKLKLRRENKKE